MKLKSLLIINAIITAIFGIAFVIIPWQVYLLYGVEPNPQLNYMGKLFGAALVAFAVLSWYARNSFNSDALKAIIFAFFVGDVIGFIIALFAQLGNVVNDLGWLNVVIYFFLAIWFAYFQFKNQPKLST